MAKMEAIKKTDSGQTSAGIATSRWRLHVFGLMRERHSTDCGELTGNGAGLSGASCRIGARQLGVGVEDLGPQVRVCA